MNKLAVVTLLFVSTLPMTGETKALVTKSRVASTVESGGNFALPTACDNQARLYVKVVKPGTKMEGSLLRLSGKGALEAEFDTTGELANIYGVRPNGGIAMVRVEGATEVIDNFGPDGKRESSVRLERPPKPFFPSQIAMFHSGEILLSGVQYHPGYKASTAIYDPAGHLVKQFVLDGDAEIERAVEVGDARYTRSPGGGNTAVLRSVAITGDDDLVYLMRATSPATVYVISPAGEVARKIVVSAPTATGLPDFGIRVAKNRLVLRFSRSCDGALSLGSCHGTIYTVVDVTTGHRLGDYDGENETAGPIACYASEPDRFFTFWTTTDQHHLEIVESAPQ